MDAEGLIQYLVKCLYCSYLGRFELTSYVRGDAIVKHRCFLKVLYEPFWDRVVRVLC